ncbi:hypothetical protein JCM11491_007141 [Sporobolomyces phaffii]
MKRIASRLRSALASDSEDFAPPPRRAIEGPPSLQQVDLFGPSLDPIPAPISPEQERGRDEFERARTRHDATQAKGADEGHGEDARGKVENGPSARTDFWTSSPTDARDPAAVVAMIYAESGADDRKTSTESNVPLYRSDQSQTQDSPERRPSVQPPSWTDAALVPSLTQFAFSHSPANRSPTTPIAPHLAPHSSLRGRHNVSFALPAGSNSPHLNDSGDKRRTSGNSLALQSSLDSSDSMFSPAVSEPPPPSPRLLLPAQNRHALVRTSLPGRHVGPIAPTSVVRWKVDNEKEYELSKLVGKDVFEDALQDENLITEFQQYFAAHCGDASLLNLYIDLRSFSAQSTKLRSIASSIISTYFNEYSPSRLQLPISLRGPIIHSLTPLSSTLLSLETAEQDLFTRIHHDHFEGFTQERLVGMGSEWLGEPDPGKDEVDWAGKGLGNAFCLTNPRLNDNPMILCSEGFSRLTGYAVDEIIGLNCRVFQGDGPSTSQSSYSAIREAVYNEKPITKLVLNYRRNGEPFYNLIQIMPIKNLVGDVQFFLGGVSDVTDLLHPFSTKPPNRNATSKTAILLARPASRKIVYATPDVGFSSSTSLLGLDLLNLLSPPSAASPALLSTPTPTTAPRAEPEPAKLTSQAAIAGAIRRGETWRGPVELDCRGGGGGGEDGDGDGVEDDRDGDLGPGTALAPGIASIGIQRTATCILHLAPLVNEDGKPKMLVIVLA